MDRQDDVPPTTAGGVGARRLRIAPSGRAVAGLALLVALAVVTALVALWLARPGEDPVPSRAPTVGSPLEAGGGAAGRAGAPPGPEADDLAGAGGVVGAGGTAAPPTTSAAAGRLLVHVVGAVRDPGVVELAPGSRVTDAVEAAGGVTRRAALESVNLARPVIDGEQVVVQRRGDPASLIVPAPSGGAASPGGAVAGGSGPAAGPLDLNSATLEQLDALPGLGPVLAQRILDWRTTNGRFSTVEELGEVSGIGEATLGDLRPLVRV